jgi:hypothetical protein
VIDNKALEDLSLVVNLTQTIKVKSSSAGADKGGSSSTDSSSSLSDHFPSFLWVLRDFSLKLVDDKGKRITSHTYFENCLLPQAGFTEGIESKNRIRNLITEFFRDRDCVALVRPVEDEEVVGLTAGRGRVCRPDRMKSLSCAHIALSLLLLCASDSASLV